MIDGSGVETTETYNKGEAKVTLFKTNISESNLTLTMRVISISIFSIKNNY